MAKELTLPPYPAQAMPGDYIWVDWWRQLQKFMRDILAELDNISKTWKFADLGNNSTFVFRGTDEMVYGPVGVTHVEMALSQGICAFSVTTEPLDNLPSDTPVVEYPGVFTIKIQGGGIGPGRERLPAVSGGRAGCYVTVTGVGGIGGGHFEGWGNIQNVSGDLYISISTNLVRNTAFIMHATGSFLVALA